MKNLTFFTLIVLVGGILAGCQGNSAYYGKGPMVLSPNSQMHFEKYLTSNPSTFLVTTDGRNSYYRYCPDTACRTEPVTVGLYNCEKHYGKECRIYAVKDKVVWQFDASNQQGVAYKPNNQQNITHQFLADWGGLFSDKLMSASFSHSMNGKLSFYNSETGICNGTFRIDQDSAKPVTDQNAVEYKGDWALSCGEGQSAQGDVRMVLNEKGKVTDLAGNGEDENGQPLVFKKTNP
ncbi:hypothetical protein [Aestuariispira insulae]|uniref:Lipoprotein n=1 Tax=Aestuariispira insulae TaxID=1461337 RepID=A0A3D9HJL0_9PROT|nr:hypothetical protein [Aestuariispira insulae]RED49687.1 hypothetical protein DFP90_10558 [Aestuariispira insulae]